MNQREQKQLSLLAEISSLYYEKNLSQAEIADRFFLSRTRISRLLQQAKEKGVIEIKINYTLERNYDLEHRFKERFGLREVYLLNDRGKEPAEIKHGVGSLAASYLKKRITKKITLGISWGRTISETINALSIDQKIPIDVIQLMGAESLQNHDISAQELVRKFAEIYAGKAYYLNAPLFIEDEYVKKKLISDPIITKVLEMALHADIILTGIGSIDQVKTTTPWLGYMSRELFREIKTSGAVGSLCAHFYDMNGNEIDSRWNKQCIGLDLKTLRKFDEVVAVSAGQEKAAAILGAIRGKYINVLISNSEAANTIMEYK